jgi:hypothetical protein
MPSSNTNAASFMIGEKASDLIPGHLFICTIASRDFIVRFQGLSPRSSPPRDDLVWQPRALALSAFFAADGT